MNADLFLVIGLIVSGLAIPSIVSSFVDRRTPRIASIMVMIGGGMIMIAILQKPGGYTFQEIPQAFARVIGKYTN
ncbi:hypothetical protein [Profundibacter sp.]